jgi:hypothetical protein
MRYFDTAARGHHADEEVDLFPALLETMAGSDAVCLHEMMAAQTAEHRQLESRWRALRLALEQVAAGGPALLAPQDVKGFTDLYERHIAREEAELLPMVQRLLSGPELDRIGRAMRLRRNPAQVDLPAPSGFLPAQRDPERGCLPAAKLGYRIRAMWVVLGGWPDCRMRREAFRSGPSCHTMCCTVPCGNCLQAVDFPGFGWPRGVPHQPPRLAEGPPGPSSLAACNRRLRHSCAAAPAPSIVAAKASR